MPAKTTFPLLAAGIAASLLLEKAPALPVPIAQMTPEERLPDPSGSRDRRIYARRYQVECNLTVKGNARLQKTELQQLAVAAVQRAGVNRSHITFVDTNIDRSRRYKKDVHESGDYDTRIPGTPEKGNFIPATDRLELDIVVQRDLKRTKDSIRLHRDVSADVSQITDNVTLRLSGRVISIDTGAIAYALEPVQVTRSGRIDQSINAKRTRDENLIGGLLGAYINFKLAREQEGIHTRTTQTPRDLIQIFAAFDAAADQIVTQLETAEPLGLPPLSAALSAQ